MTQVITRFAPSPTGRLHLGHAYSALLAQDFARRRKGIFLLRIEDIDSVRCRAHYINGIFEDLAWLGIDFDGEAVRQSHRLPLYAAALAKLREQDLIYPCFCTRSQILAEVRASAAAPHSEGGTAYPGTCRTLSRQEQQKHMGQAPHAWRLDMAKAVAATGPLHWRDEEEEIEAKPEKFGDVVLARKDAPVSYHLAVTIDDAAQNISDVVRGKDLRTATHIHRLLQGLLQLPVPHYHHHPLLTDADGQRLAKRQGAPTLAELREGGVDPRRLVADLRAGRLAAGYSAQDS